LVKGEKDDPLLDFTVFSTGKRITPDSCVIYIYIHIYISYMELIVLGRLNHILLGLSAFETEMVILKL